MKYLGTITDNKDLTTKAYVDGGDAANQASLATFVRPNLLDNWYFVGGGSQQGGGQFPINQRGQTSYTSNSSKYSIDRWITRQDNATFSLETNGFKATGTSSIDFVAIGQTVENGVQLLAGKTVTLSFLVEANGATNPYFLIGNSTDTKSAGTTYGLTYFSGTGLISKTITLPSNLSNPYLGVWIVVGNSTYGGQVGDYLTISAVKLELGDTQTLAHQENGEWVLNEIPDYQEQLFRCQTSTADSSDTYANKPNLVGFKVNPNLLDNWYFVGGGSQQGGGQFPINQRGKTSYSTAGAYAVDRWYNRASLEASLASDGMKLALTATSDYPYLTQRLEHYQDLLGKTVTISCLISGTNDSFHGVQMVASSSNSVGTNSTTLGITDGITAPGLYSKTFTMPDAISASHTGINIAFYFMATNRTVGDYCVVSACKLELGDTQTLAHQENGEWVLNEIPNYAEQLERCQRFFIEINSTRNAYCKPGMGYAYLSIAAAVFISHPTMRATPSVSYVGSWVLEDYLQNYKTVSAMSVDTTSTNGSTLIITASGMTDGRLYALMANNNNTANIYLSADL